METTQKKMVTHGSDRPDLSHESGAACELCSTLGMNPRIDKRVLTLRKLRDRLSDVIAGQERRGTPERVDLPICFALSLERGRGQWYLPAEYVAQLPIGLRLPEGLVEVFEIKGFEDKAIKDFAHRARRNSGKRTK